MILSNRNSKLKIIAVTTFSLQEWKALLEAMIVMAERSMATSDPGYLIIMI